MSGKGNGAAAPGDNGQARREQVREAVIGAPIADIGVEVSPGFEQRQDGWWHDPGQDKTPYRVFGPLDIVAESRSKTGDDWGLLLEWRDNDGTLHRWLMPRRLLAGQGSEVQQRLAAGGLYVNPQQRAREAQRTFLMNVRVSARVWTVSRTGWHWPPGSMHPVFVLPGRTIGAIPGAVVVLDLDPPPTVYAARGTLEGWRREVAALCVGNTRLVFSVSCSFTGSLLPLQGEEGGGVNLRGSSSQGKTTVIDVAASAWGPPSKVPDSFVRQWRSTANALETTAAMHSHALLPMDEMGQADPREVGETAYMIANGVGKERARAGGGNRQPTTWLTFVLASSEVSVGALMAGVGQRLKAGQEVRLLDVPAIVPGGHGCFEELHGAADGAAFAQRLRRAVVAQHGTAAPAFLEWLTVQLAREPDFAAKEIAPDVVAWERENVPAGADGQVRRAARRFALVAVAGELATKAGVTGWPAGEASRAAAALFHDWLLERGGLGCREDHYLFAAVRGFIGMHGSSRFETLKDEKADSRDGEQAEPPLPEGAKTIQRAGWRWQEVDEEGHRVWVHGMLPDVFVAEVCGQLGMEERDAHGRLARAGLIRTKTEKSGKRRFTLKDRRVPGLTQAPRLVVFVPGILDGEDRSHSSDGGNSDLPQGEHKNHEQEAT
jgi:putative DNA primase/helicase